MSLLLISMDSVLHLCGESNAEMGLTDPRILSGIGNAYSDEILHAAQLSPILQNA
jgi:formamidopyrimidine-DNA glycosylase